MKIWITFNTVFSLQCGGLERCRVWFSKPRYIYVDRLYEYDSLPFGGGNQLQGLESFGWRSDIVSDYQNKVKQSLSLGELFNYEGEISDLIWDKLCEFFQSDDLRQWDIKEKELGLHPKDFMVELEIDIILKKVC